MFKNLPDVPLCSVFKIAHLTTILNVLEYVKKYACEFIGRHQVSNT